MGREKMWWVLLIKGVFEMEHKNFSFGILCIEYDKFRIIHKFDIKIVVLYVSETTDDG